MIDKRMLVDSLTAKKVIGKDGWGKPIYSEPVALSPVRFDRSIATIQANKADQWRKTGTVFVYTRYVAEIFDESWLHGVINDGDRDYTIVAIAPQYSPFTLKVLCYELDVI